MRNLVQMATTYNTDEEALAAYAKVQALVFDNDCDLSCFRIKRKGVPTVAVVGETSPDNTITVHLAIVDALKGGSSATLDADTWQTLRERRGSAMKIGPWVEGHYRGGLQL